MSRMPSKVWDRERRHRFMIRLPIFQTFLHFYLTHLIRSRRVYTFSKLYNVPYLTGKPRLLAAHRSA